jgi:hypothetical protein
MHSRHIIQEREDEVGGGGKSNKIGFALLQLVDSIGIHCTLVEK